MAKPLKKTETIEIRLAHETKLAFMERCRDEGVTASEALRTFIGHRLETPPAASAAPRAWRRRLQVAAALTAAFGVAATAVPSLAGSADRLGFRELDVDRDGGVTRLEMERRFISLDADGNGSVNLAEFRARNP